MVDVFNNVELFKHAYSLSVDSRKSRNLQNVINGMNHAIGSDAEVESFWGSLSDGCRSKVLDDILYVYEEFRNLNLDNGYLPFGNMIVIQGAYYVNLVRLEVFDPDWFDKNMFNYDFIMIARGLSSAVILGGTGQRPTLTTSKTLRTLALTDSERFMDIINKLVSDKQRMLPLEDELFILRNILGCRDMVPAFDGMEGSWFDNGVMGLDALINDAWDGNDGDHVNHIGRYQLDYGLLTMDDVERMERIDSVEVRGIREALQLMYDNGDAWFTPMFKHEIGRVSLGNPLLNRSNWRTIAMLMLPLVREGEASYTLLPAFNEMMRVTKADTFIMNTVRNEPYASSVNMMQDYMVEQYSWFIEHLSMPQAITMDDYADDYGIV